MGEFWEKITGSISAGSSAPPKWFRRDNLLILVLLGVLLFIIALPVKKEDPAATDTGTEITEQYNAGILTSSGQQNVAQQDTVYVGTQAVTAGSMEEYAAYLEEKLKKMLESVRGCGRGGGHDHAGILGGKNRGERHDRRTLPDRGTGFRGRNPYREFIKHRISDGVSGGQSGLPFCSEDDHPQSGRGSGGGGRSRKGQYDWRDYAGRPGTFWRGSPQSQGAGKINRRKHIRQGGYIQ